ncbi:MAG: hypothetical protein IJX28_08365 [Clostridia bacterium]|nr:hypothetical protein [Clostridia bacterium]
MKAKRQQPPLSGILREAEGRIAAEGNRLTLILAWMLFAMTCILCLFFREVFLVLGWWTQVELAWPQSKLALFELPLGDHGLRVLLDWVDLASIVTGGAVILFLALPLLHGILELSLAMVEGKDAPLSLIFRPFSGARRYRRCLRSSFALLWRGALTVMAVTATYSLVSTLFAGNLAAGVICAVLILGELFLGFWLCVGLFPLFYCTVEDGRMPWRSARAAAVKLRRAFPLCGFRFFGGFLPRILLGCCTLGILLLADTLPMMCLTYTVECKKMSEIYRLEENDHE